MASLDLRLLAGDFSICRLASDAAAPAWAASPVFTGVIRTADELTVLCPSRQVPGHVRHEAGWRLLQLRGPFPFSATGILASVLNPLAGAGIGILAQSTFDTDYVLVPADRLEEALAALTGAGHRVTR